MDATPLPPIVFSRDDIDEHQPAGSPRIYRLAPLSYRQAAAMRADLAREAGSYPGDGQLLAAMRAAIARMAPANAAELLAAIDQAEAEPGNLDAATTLMGIEAAISADPTYADLLAQRERHLAMMPWVTARHCLRGWDGPGLPAFAQQRGLVADDLLDAIPHDELRSLGYRAAALQRPGAVLHRFSGAPSPSPETPAPSTEG